MNATSSGRDTKGASGSVHFEKQMRGKTLEENDFTDY